MVVCVRHKTDNQKFRFTDTLKQNCIQEARTVFQNIFCYLVKHRFLSSTYAGQKEEAYRKYEETVTLNI